MYTGKKTIVAKIQTDRSTALISEEKRLVHLLKRALAGVSLSEYYELKDHSLSSVVNCLLTTTPAISPPFSWIDDNSYDREVNQLRKQSVIRWFIGSLYAQKKSVQPKMVLFWHNFFPIQTSRLTFANTVFDYFFTLHNYALGDIRMMLLCLVTGSALPEYYKKIKQSSGTVYSFYAERICFHLYGEHFQEYVSKSKLQKYARLLYEWSVVNERFSLPRVLSSTGLDIQKPAIRQCLEALHEFQGKLVNHEKAVGYMAERLFRYFVYTDIDKSAEKRIIRRMTGAAMVNFNTRDILQSLFLNEEFYNMQYFGNMPKSPVDFLFETCKLNKTDLTDHSQVSNYPLWDWILQQAAQLGQPVGDIPDEKGWPGYYRSPQQEWLTSGQYFERKKLISVICEEEFFPESWDADTFTTWILNTNATAGQLELVIETLVIFFCSTFYTREKVQVVETWLAQRLEMNRQKWKRLTDILTNDPHQPEAREIVRTVLRSLITYFQNEAEYNFV
jgi:hypothetical protein